MEEINCLACVVARQPESHKQKLPSCHVKNSAYEISVKLQKLICFV